jgi:hypothetical protein
MKKKVWQKQDKERKEQEQRHEARLYHRKSTELYYNIGSTLEWQRIFSSQLLNYH